MADEASKEQESSVMSASGTEASQDSKVPSKATTTNMKVWKMVSGILSIVFSCFILFQSCAAGLGESLSDADTSDGSLGLLVALMVMAGGIVSIVTKKSLKGGNIALIILFGLGALAGYSGSGYYGDLVIWATWSLVCAVLAVVALVRGRGKQLAE